MLVYLLLFCIVIGIEKLLVNSSETSLLLIVHHLISYLCVLYTCPKQVKADTFSRKGTELAKMAFNLNSN